MAYPYDEAFDPPAPVVLLSVASPVLQSPITVRALVDSGADITALPRSIVGQLGLRRVARLLASGLDGVPSEQMVYSALIGLEAGEPQIIQVLAWDDEYALLGRDLLNRHRAVLDGPNRVLEIA